MGGGGLYNTNSNNIANGYQALYSNTIGRNNIANGYQALYSNTKGYNNIANGYQALYSNTTGVNNIANGESALYSNTTGYGNIANGDHTLINNTTGCYNTASGFNALCYNTTGCNNTAFSYQTLFRNTTGSCNTAIGTGALGNNTTGHNNTAAGLYALYGNTTGRNNTANGIYTLYGNTIGSENTAAGNRAGYYLSDGSTKQTITDNSVFIGAYSRGSAEDNQTNQIVIGYQAQGYGSNTAHIGNSDIGSISYGAGTGTTFTNRSDPRIKEDIQEADLDICYEDVKRLPLRRFKYKGFVGNSGDQHLTGFLSDEFEEVLPKAVHKTTQTFDKRDENGEIIYKTITVEEKEHETDPKTGEIVEVVKQVEKQVPEQVLIKDCASIDTSQLVPMLFGALQKVITKLEVTEAQVAALEAQK